MIKVINKNTLVTENADMEMIHRDEFNGSNTIHDKRESLLKRLVKAFINPISALFFVLAIILVFMGEADSMVIMFISAVVLIYGFLRFE